MDSATTNNELEILGSNLLLLRQQYGFSQKHMAIILGIGVKSLRQLERGCLPPRLGIDFLFRIQDTFHIRPHTLLTSLLLQKKTNIGEAAADCNT